MAVRGQKPKPAGQKVTTGNPGHRPIVEGPAFAAGDDLAPPKRWKKKGQERIEWARIVPELQRVGVAKSVHQGVLEKVCELYAASVELYRLRDYTGSRMQAGEYRKALNEFGLTAASAGRVSGQGGDGHQDPADQFFTGPRLAR